MANTLYPAYVRLDYTTVFGQHSMNIPVNEVTPGATFGDNTVESWEAGAINLSTMINGLIDLLKPFYTEDDSFDLKTLFTLATPASDPVWRNQVSLVASVGTGTDIGWQKAVQTTVSIRSTEGGVFRVQMMDSGSFDEWNKLTNLSTIPAVEDIVEYVSDPENGFRARDGGRPAAFIEMSKTLNEQLRKSYKMF